MNKTAAHPALEGLRLAKGESDRGNYNAKHRIIRELMEEDPDAFEIDSENLGTYGITHSPTGFKIHVLRKVVPPGIGIIERRKITPVGSALSTPIGSARNMDRADYGEMAAEEESLKVASMDSVLKGLGLNDRLNPGGGSTEIAISEPPGSENSRNAVDYVKNKVLATKPGLRSVMSAGHSAGSQFGHVFYPTSYYSKTPEGKATWAEGVHSTADTWRGLTGKVPNPDVVFASGCNGQGADMPLLLRDALGKSPPLFVATPPHYESNINSFTQAVDWGLQQKQPWLFPKQKSFSAPHGGPYHSPNAPLDDQTTAYLSPRIAPGVSIPTAGAVAGLGISEIAARLIYGKDRAKKEKHPWVRRGLSAAAGVGAGHLFLLAAEKLRRRAAIDGSKVMGFRSGAPLISDYVKTGALTIKPEKIASMDSVLKGLGLNDRLNPGGGESRLAISEPVGNDFNGSVPKIKELVMGRPGMNAIMNASHSAGSQMGFIGYPTSRFDNTPKGKGEWADGVYPVADAWRAGKGEVGSPDALFSYGCNRAGADLPMLAKDALGAIPPLMVAASPGHTSDESVFNQAAEWGMKQKQPWLFPSQKSFGSSVPSHFKGTSREATAYLSPRIAPEVSIPTAGAVAGLGISEILSKVIRGKEKEKHPWLRRGLSAAGGAAAGGLFVMAADRLRRTAAYANSGSIGPRVGNLVSEVVTNKAGAWDRATDVRKEITNGRPYPFSYFTGEAKELGEALVERDWSHIKEEAGDTAYAAQMLFDQATGLNLPMIGTKSVVEKFRDRLTPWKREFEAKNIPFSTDYLSGGSNYAKPHKVRGAFALAGHDLPEGEEHELSLRMGEKMAAIGIPDRSDLGDISQLKPGELVDYIIQEHRAKKMGPHRDVRLGTEDTGLFSWATKKQFPPEVGKPVALYRQPLHSHDYGDFEGEIESGYGAGTVTQALKRKALITKADPSGFSFTQAEGEPNRYRFKAPDQEPDPWMAFKAGEVPPPRYAKTHMKSAPIEKIMDNLPPDGTFSLQPKVDGALQVLRWRNGKPEVISHRTSVRTGKPITHTEKVFGQVPDVAQPVPGKGLEFLGEFTAERGGKPVPPQETGGYLNSSIMKAILARKAGLGGKLRLFDVEGANVPYPERRKMLEAASSVLPDTEVVPEVTTRDEARKLVQDILSGTHPLTREGVVYRGPDGRPIKSKVQEETDVHVTGTFPGKGKFSGGPGGFTYAREAGGPTVGRVGTGLSDETRRSLESYIGRTARVRHLGGFDSGAHKAPSLLAFHEDYPSKTALATDSTNYYPTIMSIESALSSQPLAQKEAGLEGILGRALGSIGRTVNKPGLGRSFRAIDKAKSFPGRTSPMETGYIKNLLKTQTPGVAGSSQPTLLRYPGSLGTRLPSSFTSEGFQGYATSKPWRFSGYSKGTGNSTYGGSVNALKRLIGGKTPGSGTIAQYAPPKSLSAGTPSNYTWASTPAESLKRVTTQDGGLLKNILNGSYQW